MLWLPVVSYRIGIISIILYVDFRSECISKHLLTLNGWSSLGFILTMTQISALLASLMLTSSIKMSFLVALIVWLSLHWQTGGFYFVFDLLKGFIFNINIFVVYASHSEVFNVQGFNCIKLFRAQNLFPYCCRVNYSVSSWSWHLSQFLKAAQLRYLMNVKFTRPKSSFW